MAGIEQRCPNTVHGDPPTMGQGQAGELGRGVWAGGAPCGAWEPEGLRQSLEGGVWSVWVERRARVEQVERTRHQGRKRRDVCEGPAADHG